MRGNAVPLPLSIDQLRLISFGPRRDIVAVLANDTDLSARDIAGRLGRRVTALYRHLDLLSEAGLILQSGTRAGPKRPEALFALAARTYQPSPRVYASAEGRRAMGQAGARYASAAARKLARAVESGGARPFAADANVAFYNTDLQLDRSGLVEFNERLHAFLDSVRDLRVPGDDGLEQITLTVLVAPTR
jgi:predicted ArsR family transcriptional regulator